MGGVPKTQKYGGYFCTTWGGCPYILQNHKSIKSRYFFTTIDWVYIYIILLNHRSIKVFLYTNFHYNSQKFLQPGWVSIHSSKSQKYKEYFCALRGRWVPKRHKSMYNVVYIHVCTFVQPRANHLI